MRFRKKKERSVAVEEFDITSLLDILVILLVFLLKSFNDSELTVDLVNELALPFSQSRGVTQYGPVVQVNKNLEVFINDKSIGNMKKRGLVTLEGILKSEFKLDNENRVKRGKEKTQNKKINLVFDKGLNYLNIHKVLELSSSVGYGQYKLIVQGDE